MNIIGWNNQSIPLKRKENSNNSDKSKHLKIFPPTKHNFNHQTFKKNLNISQNSNQEPKTHKLNPKISDNLQYIYKLTCHPRT